MILQSLAALYDALAAKGKLERPGWLPMKISWGLEIDQEGKLLYVLPLQVEEQRGKKTVLVPQVMNVPAPPKRTVGVDAGFLCDNGSYVLGMDDKGNPERTQRCFQAFREKHHELIGQVKHPAAQALLRFLDGWNPEKAAEHPALAEYVDEICKGGNIVFEFEGQRLHEIPELKEVWQNCFSNDGDAVVMQCLVTGQQLPVQKLHPNIKGVPGAQSSGASLVAFNFSALESYGCNDSKGLNAPVSTQAAFAYGAALNYLLAESKHHLPMGETTVVYWAKDGEGAYAEFMSDLFGSNTMDDQTIGDALALVAKGKNADWKGMPLDADSRFFILGLAPNAARLSVRFFLNDTFGDLMRNVAKHQEHLQIVKPAYDTWNELSLWWLLNETVNQQAKNKQPQPQMVGDLARAIWQGTPYPATLYEQTQLRIRAERKVTRGRAAIIKAYLTRQPSFVHKEVLTVELNKETRYAPYLLGRLFAVLEALQEKANPGINATIRDKYFSSASATPAVVFPTLIRLAQAHLKKLDDRSRIYFDKQLGQLLGQLESSYPARLSLQDQGVLQLGYYHQTQKRFAKKEDESNE